MQTVLVEATPAVPATGLPTTVRFAGGGVGAYDHLGHSDWLAGVQAVPTFSAAIDFDANGWTGGAKPQTGTIVFLPADDAVLSRLAALYWIDAALTIWTVDDRSAAAPALYLKGRVAGVEVGTGRLAITLADLSGDLSKPLLGVGFAGTGGIEGDVEATGRAKRRSWGHVFNVEGQLLLKASNVFEFGDPAQPLSDFVAVRDKGRAAVDRVVVGWAGSIAATLNALVAAAAPAGGGAVAPSIACVKWWTQPVGPLTADILGEIGAGYVEAAAPIAAAIVASASTLAVDAALAGAGGPVVGIHIDDANESAAQVLDWLLLGVGLLWTVTSVGVVTLLPWRFGADASIAWDAVADPSPAWDAMPDASPAWSSPAVDVETLRSISVERQRTLAPLVRRDLGYRRNHRVHTDAEVSAAITADTVIYADGTPVEALKPAQPNADVTADNIAKDTAKVSGRTAASVLSGIDANVDAILAQALRQDNLVQVLDARTLVEGQPIGTKFLAFRDQASDPITGFASASDFSGVFTKGANGTGYTMNLQSVKAGNASFADVLSGYNQSIGDLTGTVGTLTQNLQVTAADAGSAKAQITDFKAAYASATGQGFAKALVSVDVNGRMTGYSATSDGHEGVFHIVADRFVISAPGDANGVSPFSVQGGVVTATNFRADIITYGSLVAKFTEVGRQSLDPGGWYQELPGGLIMQGGRYRSPINSETTVTITFPRPFPSQVLATGANGFIGTFSNLRDLWVQNVGEPSLSSAVYATQAATNNQQHLDGLDWWAWGR